MSQFFKKFILSIIVICSFCQHGYATSERVIKIGSGSLLDGYYSIGLTLCRYISKSNNGIKCDVVPTSGSLENLKLLQENKIDFAFTLSNLALDAYNGMGIFEKYKPFKDMYQLLNLHDEYFTVIVKDKDKILVFSDLDGKKISNGPPNSDSSVAYEALAAYYDFKNKPEDIEILHENYAKEFCDGKIDAVMMMTGHPNILTNMITHKCESDFVTIDSDKIDLLVKNHPGFRKVILKKGEYPGITEDQETVAVSSIFVAGAAVDKKIVENFIQFVSVRIKNLKSSDPLLNDLSDDHFMNEFVLPTFKK
ncbi:MAG: TAXI family TRAP transporter solute-binding subunit [Rickettsiales bacterium]|nr:MAG: TAXI family TRAP transporter solute-binding subunit [Rickettsiales bacterium]